MSENNQQRDELPAYMKDEPPAGTAINADISLWKWLASVIPFYNNQAFYLSTVMPNEPFYTAVILVHLHAREW